MASSTTDTRAVYVIPAYPLLLPSTTRKHIGAGGKQDLLSTQMRTY